MNDATLFIDGNRWLYSFSVNEKPCFIVGSDVAFSERKDDHLVVNLDMTETELEDGKKLGSYMTVNVPTSGLHQVIIVTPTETTECPITIPEHLERVDFIDDVLAALVQ